MTKFEDRKGTTNQGEYQWRKNGVLIKAQRKL